MAQTNLAESANRRIETNQEKLDQERLENTRRRASMAHSSREDARYEIAVGATALNLIDKVQQSRVVCLSRVTAMSQVELLLTTLQVQLRVNRKDIGAIKPEQLEKLEYPVFGLDCIERGIEDVKGQERNDCRALIAALEHKLAQLRSQEQTIWRPKTHTEMKQLRRLRELSKDDNWQLAYMLNLYSTLFKLRIFNKGDLQETLQALLDCIVSPEHENPVAKLERDLIGVDIAGFVPTPKDLIAEMIRLAQIEDHHLVLDPSAGKGDILEEVAKIVGQKQVHGIEIDYRLRAILENKGFELVGIDFLEWQAETPYERILLNPPFEQLADTVHIRHAYEQLAEGGILVAISSESPFFSQKKMAQEFRDWLDDVGGYANQNPQDSFAKATKGRGIQTRMIVIEK